MTLTIEQLMKINLAIETYTDDNGKLLEVVTNIVYGTLDIEKSKTDQTMSELNELLSTEFDLIQRFEYNNVEYGFIPNLSKITTGEFIDLDNYMNGSPKQLHKIASILYRPVTNKAGKFYEIEKYEGTEKHSNTMMNVDCKVILGAMVFFYNLSNSLLHLTNTYIQKELKKRTS